jgi:plastocyanin
MKVFRYSFFAAVMLLLVSSLQARTWTIGVNPSTFHYTVNGGPDITGTSAAFTANVGDTLDFEMDFSNHNLGIANATTPQTPSVLDKGYSTNTAPKGTSIKYVADVAGTFIFACSFHQALGMVAGFNVVAGGSGVNPQANSTINIQSLFPNPANAATTVNFELTEPAHVKLLVFDASGKLAMTALDEQMQPGAHAQTIDTKQLASGSYQYVLQAGDATLRRQAIIVR